MGLPECPASKFSAEPHAHVKDLLPLDWLYGVLEALGVLLSSLGTPCQGPQERTSKEAIRALLNFSSDLWRLCQMAVAHIEDGSGEEP